MRIDDSRPIWAQLVDEFRRRIASGQWTTGSRLPSVRELALELGVNPNTVQKALGEVDRIGLTAAERTSGRFVTRDADIVAEAREALAASAADGFIAAAAGLGMSLDDANRLVARRWTTPESNDTEGTQS